MSNPKTYTTCDATRKQNKLTKWQQCSVRIFTVHEPHLLIGCACTQQGVLLRSTLVALYKKECTIIRAKVANKHLLKIKPNVVLTGNTVRTSK